MGDSESACSELDATTLDVFCPCKLLEANWLMNDLKSFKSADTELATLMGKEAEEKSNEVEKRLKAPEPCFFGTLRNVGVDGFEVDGDEPFGEVDAAMYASWDSCFCIIRSCTRRRILSL